MSGITFTGCHKPLSDDDIKNFESEHGLQLPEHYRRFLLRTNGGHPHKHRLSSCYVQGFNAITCANDHVSLQNEIAKMKEELPAGVIPIGYTGTGDRLCLSLATGIIYLWERGKVYEFHPVRLSELTLLATNIDELLIGLEGNDLPIPDDEISNLGRWGDVELLDNYLNRGHGINEVSIHGDTLARCAVYAGDLKFLKECVRRGAILKDRRMLHAAMFKMDNAIVKYLLDQGLDPNELDENGKTPLDKAPPPGTGPAAQLLRSRGGLKSRQP